jgi:leucyl aminopeptidase
MNITVVHQDALSQATPLLVLGTWDAEPLAAPLAELLEPGDWTGAFKKTLLVYPRGVIPARRLLLVGLGKRDQASAERLTEAAAVAAHRARDLRAESYSFELPQSDRVAPAAAAQALAEGSLLGLYQFLSYRTGLSEQDRFSIGELAILSGDPAAEAGARTGAAIARGVILARDLANGPGNDITPARLGEEAQALGQRAGLQVTVLGLDELKAQGFGGIVGVGQGSAQPPRFIIMEYGAAEAGRPTVCLVGKGITFDTGGISIKPADRMDEMKMDMGGAAAVFGTMQAVAELQLPVHVVGLVASAENMPSSTAYKPGDILKTLSGKTIEVLNTDAEGRIVLADALYYAQRYQPDGIIDLATLTGAIVVALGTQCTGIMANSDALAERVLQAGEATGERAWRLPLWEAYSDNMKSDIADIKNTGGRYGGAINAAAFLEHFVGGYPWVHMDIAGTAWTDQKPKAYAPKGATGVGVRLLIQALRTWSEARR